MIEPEFLDVIGSVRLAIETRPGVRITESERKLLGYVISEMKHVVKCRDLGPYEKAVAPLAILLLERMIGSTGAK